MGQIVCFVQIVLFGGSCWYKHNIIQISADTFVCNVRDWSQHGAVLDCIDHHKVTKKAAVLYVLCISYRRRYVLMAGQNKAQEPGSTQFSGYF